MIVCIVEWILEIGPYTGREKYIPLRTAHLLGHLTLVHCPRETSH